MARFRRRTFNRPQQRRRSEWLGNEITTGGINSVGAAAATIYQAKDIRTDAAMFGGTLARTHGLFSITSDVPVSGESPFGAIGIAVVDGEAFDAGVASLPTPYTEADDGKWLFHSYWQVAIRSSTVDFGFNTQITIDSKAMRKLGANDVIVWIIENKSSAHAASFFWATRMLIMLP